MHFLQNKISYLDDTSMKTKTNICFLNEKTSFCEELKIYVDLKKELFSKQEERHDRVTRQEKFTMKDAMSACEMYIDDLWKH